MKTLNITVLENALNQIEDFIPHSESINTAVSKANIAWHLDHSLKVVNAVIENMEKSDPTLYKDNFSFLGKLFFKLGYFPRGRAKAPKYVKPPEVILNSAIVTQLAEARANIKKILTLDKNAYFKHPLFGNVDSTRVIRFLGTHTNHHLKIVKGILK